MDFTATPNGASVSLATGAGDPGLYRVVPAGAAAAPVRLILQDLSPQVTRWGVPVDRGWLCEATDYCFRVPPGCQELSLRYGLLTPWEKLTVQLLDAVGQPLQPPAHTATERWQTSWLTWRVPVPAAAPGQMWRFANHQRAVPSCVLAASRRLSVCSRTRSLCPRGCRRRQALPPPRHRATGASRWYASSPGRASRSRAVQRLGRASTSTFTRGKAHSSSGCAWTPVTTAWRNLTFLPLRAAAPLAAHPNRDLLQPGRRLPAVWVCDPARASGTMWR